MRILADLHRCEGLGMCEAMADRYFEVGDDGQVLLLDDHPREQDRQLVDSAVKSCPVSALRLEN
ncbi:ferredoxin [Streptomyces sp. NBC_01352]|uniref:ferredoxin n=1 Tax=Streptomyces sp. NBC_01352 TaxID=2903834 RepID=UPI002E35D6D9|nr:ferredoxin [Streptomyces sp. NBC_01352]